MLRRNQKVELIRHAPLFANCSKRALEEIALVSDTPRTATVTATTPVRALVITDRSFRRLLKDQPEIHNKVLSALAARLAPEVL